MPIAHMHILTLLLLSWHCSAELGKMTSSYLLKYTSTFDPTGRRHSFCFQRKVGSQGQCLLPSTFGKVAVEGTIFDFGFWKSSTFDIEMDNDQCQSLNL